MDGVCDLAACSFGLRPSKLVILNGQGFPKNPSMTYPQDDLSNCPAIFKNPLISAAYELPGACMNACVCVCVCVCVLGGKWVGWGVSRVDDLKHIAVG